MPDEQPFKSDAPLYPPLSSADPCPDAIFRPAVSDGGDWVEGDEGSGSAYLSVPELRHLSGKR